MIDSADRVLEVLNRDPNIDPYVFWPRVGCSADAVMLFAHAVSETTGISFSAAMGFMESGATLAEAGLQEKEESNGHTR